MKVKNSIATAVLVLLGFNAGAQTMYDAFRYSENNYLGSARTIGMGNAFTALGGDLGSIGLNPAGSSVNRYSQFIISPNVSILSSASNFITNPDNNQSYNDNIKAKKTAFSIPNLGVVMNFNTGRRSGIKNMSLGVVMNGTSNYMDKVIAYGTNDQTSMMASLAASATANGIPSDKLDEKRWDDGYDWRHKVAYQSGMLATIDDARMNYIAATEKLKINENSADEISLGGPLDQTYAKSSYGYKYDILTNFGMNINDRIYLGANLGVTSLYYETDSYFKEEAVNPADFENDYGEGRIVNFHNGLMGDYYGAQASGVYFKVGIIARPFNNLRIGAAIQTPTMTTISEKWQIRGETHFSDRAFDARANSNMGEYEYRLVSPYRANFGLAYTTRYGLFSADYEFTDYSLMRFKELNTDFSTQFDLVNRLNKRFFGFQHQLRLGAEARLPLNWAVRLGYNLITSPERTWQDAEGPVDAGVFEMMYYDSSESQFRDWEHSLNGMQYIQSLTQSVSFGLGWQSKRSFFFDIACRGIFRPMQYTYPYDNYLDDGISSPEIQIKSQMWDVMATLGWRF